MYPDYSKISNFKLKDNQNDNLQSFFRFMQGELEQLKNYTWNNIKQNDTLDYKTNFIYSTYNYNNLLEKIENSNLTAIEADYAKARWFNFHTAKVVELIFSTSPLVKANKNQYDKLTDFSINSIKFDHKNSVFPAKFPYSLQDAIANKSLLIEWLYKNQSGQGRYHLGNRLFIIFYNSEDGKHWKLKANILLIENYIKDYLKNFDYNNLDYFLSNNEYIQLLNLFYDF